MKIAGLGTDEKAVSPIIGVVIMVSVTVILSAVVGAFTLGLGESQDTAPQSAWKIDYTGGSPDELTLTLHSGDAMEVDRVSVVVSGATPSAANGRYVLSGGTFGFTGEISAGSKVTVGSNVDGSLDLSSATVRLVWEDEDTDDTADSAVLVVWEGPDA